MSVYSYLSWCSSPDPTNTHIRRLPYPQAMYGDLGYGSNGHGTETRAQLGKVFNLYDFVYHIGVRRLRLASVCR